MNKADYLKKENLNKIYQGNALEILKAMPDNFVNMAITSPPYWGLRDYKVKPIIWDGNKDCDHEFGKEHKEKYNAVHNGGECERPWQKNMDMHEKNWGAFCYKCGAWRGFLGLEPHYNLYVKHLCDIFDEVKRVLRDDGTCWVVIGDTYGGSGGYGSKEYHKVKHTQFGKPYRNKEQYQPPKRIQPKCLLQIPTRFSHEMVNRGWILRNVIIWQKPSCMPESVKDRFTVDYEYVFFFAKNKKYYFEQQFESCKTNENRPYGIIRERQYNYNTAYPEARRVKPVDPDNPYKGKGWKGSIPGGGARIVREQDERWLPKEGRNKRCVWQINPEPSKEPHYAPYPQMLMVTPIKAGCPKGGVVLDPFMGSGTTAIVARKLNRNYLGIELNGKYIKIAEDRLYKELGMFL